MYSKRGIATAYESFHIDFYRDIHLYIAIASTNMTEPITFVVAVFIIFERVIFICRYTSILGNIFRATSIWS